MKPHDLDVFVVDDDPGVRKGVGGLLLSRGHAVKTFASGEDFLHSPRLDQGGCVLLDLKMEPGMSGLQVFDELRKRGSPLVVVFLSSYGDVSTSVGAMKDGASDWLEKPCSEARLFGAVEAALERASVVTMRSSVRQLRTALWDSLTPREAEVAGHVRFGKSNKVIARTTTLKVRTVEGYRARLFQKLDVGNPAELDLFMREMDI